MREIDRPHGAFRTVLTLTLVALVSLAFTLGFWGGVFWLFRWVFFT